MSTRARLEAWAEETGHSLLFADGFDAALIGTAERAGGLFVACYDQDKCLDVLIADGMDYDTAQEYFQVNVLGAYVGPETPVFARLSSSLDDAETRDLTPMPPPPPAESTDAYFTPADIEAFECVAGPSFLDEDVQEFRLRRPRTAADVEEGLSVVQGSDAAHLLAVFCASTLVRLGLGTVQQVDGRLYLVTDVAQVTSGDVGNCSDE